MVLGDSLDEDSSDSLLAFEDTLDAPAILLVDVMRFDLILSSVLDLVGASDEHP